jgi:teichuronic acid biosynthesis glycosyltransferase TuaG
MPAYNAEKYIGDSIKSVLAQTYSNWELIVVDDGSTDGTAAVVREFVDRDNRIKYFYQENGRLGKARNTGIGHAAGPLIAFLDSDDLWVETKLEAQTRAMTEKINVALDGTAAAKVDEGKASVEKLVAHVHNPGLREVND